MYVGQKNTVVLISRFSHAGQRHGGYLIDGTAISGYVHEVGGMGHWLIRERYFSATSVILYVYVQNILVWFSHQKNHPLVYD